MLVQRESERELGTAVLFFSIAMVLAVAGRMVTNFLIRHGLCFRSIPPLLRECVSETEPYFRGLSCRKLQERAGEDTWKDPPVFSFPNWEVTITSIFFLGLSEAAGEAISSNCRQVPS